MSIRKPLIGQGKEGIGDGRKVQTTEDRWQTTGYGRPAFANGYGVASSEKKESVTRGIGEWGKSGVKITDDRGQKTDGGGRRTQD